MEIQNDLGFQVSSGLKATHCVAVISWGICLLLCFSQSVSLWVKREVHPFPKVSALAPAPRALSYLPFSNIWKNKRQWKQISNHYIQKRKEICRKHSSGGISTKSYQKTFTPNNSKRKPSTIILEEKSPQKNLKRNNIYPCGKKRLCQKTVKSNIYQTNFENNLPKKTNTSIGYTPSHQPGINCKTTNAKPLPNVHKALLDLTVGILPRMMFYFRFLKALLSLIALVPKQLHFKVRDLELSVQMSPFQLAEHHTVQPPWEVHVYNYTVLYAI